MFHTPSQNIACALTRSHVRCDIVRKSWEPPARPADCELDWGNGLAISDGETTFTCTGDTLIGTSETTLAYGEGLQAGTIRCDSTSFELTCRDSRTGHGFSLSASRQSVF